MKCPHSHIVIQDGTEKTWDSGKVNVTAESCSSALNPSPALWVTCCVITYLTGKHVKWGLLRRGPYHPVCSCGHFVSKCHLLFSLASVCLQHTVCLSAGCDCIFVEFQSGAEYPASSPFSEAWMHQFACSFTSTVYRSAMILILNPGSHLCTSTCSW